MTNLLTYLISLLLIHVMMESFFASSNITISANMNSEYCLMGLQPPSKNKELIITLSNSDEQYLAPSLIVNSKIQSIRKIYNLLDSCPAWNRMGSQNDESFNSILKQLDEISKFDAALVRIAIVNYTEKNLKGRMTDIDCYARIFLLNRYIFNVPDKLIKSKRPFGGWAGIPMSDDGVNWLWPFSLDKENKLVLTGKYLGFFGPDYQFLEEFDYLHKTFGIRKK